MIGGLQRENRDLNKKNLTESVANIWDYTGGFRKLKHDLRKFLKLKGNFASCEITKCKLRNQPFLAKWRLSACEIFAAHVACCEIHLNAPRYLRSTLLDFFFRYLLFKSPFSSCNRPQRPTFV